MFDKSKNIFKIAFGLFIIFAIIFAIVSLLMSHGEITETISADEIQLYLVDSNRVKEYRIFYYIEDCFENFIEATSRNEFDKLYTIYIEDYKEVYSKEDIYAKLKEFSINTSNCKLKSVYSAGRLYILEYLLNDKTEYMFMQIGVSKNASYNFAIVK